MDLHFPLRSVFLGIPLEGESKKIFAKLQQPLESFDNIFRLQFTRSAHLTLHYWKEMMEIEYMHLIPQAKKIADASVPFTLKVEGASTFGTRDEDRVLYLDIPFDEQLAKLKKRCPWATTDAFIPHITLARMKHPQRFTVQKKKILKLFKDAAFEVVVDRLRLYAEVDGVKQTILQDFPLRGLPS